MIDPKMRDYILSSYGFKPEPYILGEVVRIGYGHVVPKTWLLDIHEMKEDKALKLFHKDLNKIQENPLISDLDGILHDICAHFIYDHGLQPFKNLNLRVLCKKKKYDAIIEVLNKAIEYHQDIPLIRAGRELDIALIKNKGNYNGYKKRIPKKNVGFSG